MNTTKKSLLAAMVGLFAAGGMGTVQAQKQMGESARAQGVLDEIVVTAQKREQGLQDVPIAVTAFSGEALGRSGITHSTDLEMVTPGLSFSVNSSDANVAIRGVGAPFAQGPGSDPSSSVYIDGVYQSRFSSALVGLMDLERVEVLKGPQGTLYGRNSTGGAISFISKAPSNEFGGNVNLRIGNYNLRDLKIIGDIPLIEDSLLFRGAINKITRDGYADNLSNPSDEIDEEDLIAGRFSLRYLPTDNLDITLRGSIMDQEGGVQAQVKNLRPEAMGGAQVVSDLRKVFTDHDHDMPKRNESVDVTVKWDMGWAEFKSITAYIDHEQGPNFRDLDGTENPYLHEGLEERDIGLVMDAETFTHEFMLSSLGDGRIDWLVGLYYLEDNPYWKTAIQLPALSVPLIQFETDNETTAYAAFANMSYLITDKLKLNIGARYSDEEKSVVQQQFVDLASVAGPISQSDSWDSFTPKVGLDYFVNDDVMLYVSASKGFKSGGYNSAAVGEPAVEPEEMDAYELGAKSTWLEGRLRANMSAYFYDYTDMQVLSPDPVNLASARLQNAGESEIKGFELEVSALLIENLQVDLGFSWIDAEYKTFVAAGGIDHSGNRLPIAPEFTGNLAVSYSYPLSSGGALDAQMNYYYSDEKFFHENNNLNAVQESYSLVNASLTYGAAGESWEVSIWGKNITDEDVVDFSVDDGFFYFEQLSPPRTYGVELTFNF